MVVGTTSHAGKSLIATAICRLLARQQFRVAPFKGQNMALNAYVTNNGGEIGYAQAVQAWAAGVRPTVDMNPILLKPQGDSTSQVILRGKAVGKVSASEYYEQYFDRGWETICTCLGQLETEYDILVCEGAGSPAEINLKHRDLTNMRIAKHLNAPTLLVVDIDRGGAFAHVVGTLELLDDDERALVKGIIINKFRGQRSILEPGIEWLEKRIGIPVLGVIPWMETLLPAEDSLSLIEPRSRKPHSELTVSVIRLPRISNFTDFDPLEAEPTVTVKYISPKKTLGYPDAVVIPGSKTTIADLLTLQQTGMDKQIQEYVDAGGTVLGICGGFQMLGQVVADPEGVEGLEGRFDGLGLLPLTTVITRQKTARQRQVTATYPQEGLPVSGYELHQGRSHFTPAKNTRHLFDDTGLGLANIETSVWGTYLHGIFDNGPWRRSWLNRLRQQRGLKALPTGIPDYREQREVVLDAIADVVGDYLDLSPLMK